jgi:hypothetical protein
MAWNSDNAANRLKQSYINNFIDISGAVTLRSNANLFVNGNIIVGSNVYTNDRCIMNADLSYNKILPIGGDVSFNQKLTVAGDVSMNGKILSCNLASNSIPLNAFNGTVTVAGPDYTKPSIIYNGNLTANNDVSLNGTTTEIGSQLNVNGNITFGDGTNLNNYVDIFEPLADISAATLYPYNFERLPSNASDAGGTFASGAISRNGQIILFNNGSASQGVAFDASNGLLLSRDGGGTFTTITVSTTLTNPTYSTVCMSPDGNHMLAYVRASANYINQELWYSHDIGVTWSKGTNTAIANDEPLYANCMSDDGKYMYQTAYQKSAILRSIDSGANWTFSTQNLYRPSISSRSIICSSDGKKVWCGSGNDFTRYISVSDDFGLNFSPTYAFGQPPSYMKGNADLSIVVVQTWNTNDMYVFRKGVMTAINMSYLGYSVSTFQPYLGISGTTDMRYIIVNANGDNAKNCLYSNDYGYTWNRCVLPYNHRGTTVLMSDTGRFVYRTGTTGVTSGIAINNNIFSNKFIKRSVYTALTVNGTLTSGSYVSSSDYRIKTNVRPLNDMISIDNLRPVKYMQTLINKEQYGLIAHELQQYFPDLVTGIKDGDSWQSVNYTGLIAILINEIKKLKAEFAELCKSIA